MYRELLLMTKSKLSKVLKTLIDNKGVSIREVSRGTGIGHSTLNNILAGRSTKPEHLMALSKYFSCSIDFLLTGQDRHLPTLEEALTEQVFRGFLKVSIERVIPERKVKIKEDSDK